MKNLGIIRVPVSSREEKKLRTKVHKSLSVQAQMVILGFLSRMVLLIRWLSAWFST